MTRILVLASIFSLNGCVPYFYEAQTLEVHAEGLSVVALGEVSENCILPTSIPKTYEVKRDLYSIQFSVQALQLGMRFTQRESTNFTFNAPDLRENEPYITKLGPEYTHYVGTTKPKIISVTIFSADREIGSEVLSLSIESCKAVIMDGI